MFSKPTSPITIPATLKKLCKLMPQVRDDLRMPLLQATTQCSVADAQHYYTYLCKLTPSTAQDKLHVELAKADLLAAIVQTQGLSVHIGRVGLSRRLLLAAISAFSLAAAAFEGFAAMATFLMVFNSIPASPIIFASLGMSVLAVFLHYGYEVAETAMHFGLSPFSVRSLLIATEKQQQALLAMLQACLQRLEAEDLSAHELEIIAKQYDFIVAASKRLQQHQTELLATLESTAARTFLKVSLAVAAGAFYALGGFFSGVEAATLATVLQFGATAVSTTAFPVIIAAGVVGAIGFLCPYIFVYSRGASNFVNSLCGIPDDIQASYQQGLQQIKQMSAHVRLSLAAKRSPSSAANETIWQSIKRLQQDCQHQVASGAKAFTTSMYSLEQRTQRSSDTARLLGLRDQWRDLSRGHGCYCASSMGMFKRSREQAPCTTTEHVSAPFSKVA